MGLVTTASPEIGRRTLVPWLWAGVFSIRLYSCVPVTKQAEKKRQAYGTIGCIVILKE